MTNKKNNFCIMPWVSLSVRTDGQLHPCCQTLSSSKMNYFKDLKASPINEIESIIKIKEAFLSDSIPNECLQCVKDETNGGSSMRTIKNGIYSEYIESTSFSLDKFELFEIDIRFSNLCQMSCLTCEPWYSTGWYQYSKDSKVPSAPIRSMEDLENLKSLLKVNSKYLKKITLTGGEPFIDPLHDKFLEFLIDNNLNNVQLEYNSSLSINSESLTKSLKLLSNFKAVKIALSIDAISDDAERIRRGLSWELFQSNAQLIKNALSEKSIYFHYTLSTLNSHFLGDVLVWIHNNFPSSTLNTIINIVHKPTEFDSQNLDPSSRKKSIAHNLKTVKENLLQDVSEEEFNHIMKLLNKAHKYLQGGASE
ncbi:MAG: radical SAM protein [Bacteriovoracaceae bacterium]|nr:radical SAM protein [Bacteriovoracaceae bacterium]